jgi:hypothetical protein
MGAGLADFHHQKTVSGGEQVNTDVYQELLSQHMVPWARRHILTESMPFGRFSAGPHCQDQQAVVGGILDSGGLAALLTGLEPELPYLECFADKDQMALHPLHLSIAKEWDFASGTLHPQGPLPLILPPAVSRCLEKNEIYIKQMVSQRSNTDYLVLFRAKISLTNTLKKYCLVHD